MNKREKARHEIWNENDYKSLKTHIGQHNFFQYLVDYGLKGIEKEAPYLKLGVSSGGKAWTELWLTKHEKIKELKNDGIFFRLHTRMNNGNEQVQLSFRQYRFLKGENNSSEIGVFTFENKITDAKFFADHLIKLNEAIVPEFRKIVFKKN